MNRALGLDWCGTIAAPGEDSSSSGVTLDEWRALRRDLERTQDVLRREYEDRARRLRRIQDEINDIINEEVRLVDTASLETNPAELRELMYAAQRSREAHDVLQMWVASFDPHLSSRGYNKDVMMPTGSIALEYREHFGPDLMNAIGRWVEATHGGRDVVPFTVLDAQNGARGDWCMVVNVESREASVRRVVDGAIVEQSDWLSLERALATVSEYAPSAGGPTS